jgi:predicted PurR-regulated permease PerM
MKEKYSNYFRWGVTVFTIIAFGILFFFFVFRMDSILEFLGKIISILTPIILGAVIAYLLNPLVTVTDKYTFSLCRRCHCSVKISAFIAMAFSIALWLGLLVAGISFLFSMIVPELYSSILKLAGDLRLYVNTIYDFINEHLQNNPQILSYVETGLDTLTNSVYNWVNNDLIIQAQNIMSKLTVGISWVVSLVTDIVVSLIVSVYLLVSKKKFLGQAKKLLYVFLKPDTANAALSIFRQTNKIFGGFISGKLIDSLIIGVLCFIGVTILRMPYTLLISVFVGITNIIPFFGPFIGAIPSAFLILLIDPGKFLIFILFIFLLQQLDGNIIGPAILGDSTGVSPFWIVFSILLGGGLFGFIGMLLGVPTFAVIYFLVKTFSEYHLKRKELPTDSMLYCKIEKIDPETGEPVLLPKRPISRRKQTDHNLVEALDAIALRRKNGYTGRFISKATILNTESKNEENTASTDKVSDSSSESE